MFDSVVGGAVVVLVLVAMVVAVRQAWPSSRPAPPLADLALSGGPWHAETEAELAAREAEEDAALDKVIHAADYVMFSDDTMEKASRAAQRQDKR
jgi:hypothetical protein